MNLGDEVNGQVLGMLIRPAGDDAFTEGFREGEMQAAQKLRVTSYIVPEREIQGQVEAAVEALHSYQYLLKARDTSPEYTQGFQVGYQSMLRQAIVRWGQGVSYERFSVIPSDLP